MIRGTWLPGGVGRSYDDASKGGFALSEGEFSDKLDWYAGQDFNEKKPERPAFIPALYTPGKPRHGEWITAITGIAADVDNNATKHDAFDAEAVLRSLPFRAYAWTTQGHGVEKPDDPGRQTRVRFFVPLAEPYPVSSVREGKAALAALAAVLERYGLTADVGADPAGVRFNQAAILPSMPDPRALAGAPQWRAANTDEGLLSHHAIPTADGGSVGLAALVEADEVADSVRVHAPALDAAEVARIASQWRAVAGVASGIVDEAIAGAISELERTVKQGDGRKRAGFKAGRLLGSAFATGVVSGEAQRLAHATARRLLRGHDAAREQLERGIQWGLARPMPAPEGDPREPLLLASARLDRWFRERWLTPGVHVAAVDMGLGKSHALHRYAVEWMTEPATDGGCGLIIVPTQAAARETQAALRALVGSAVERQRVRLDHGRSADRDSRFYCERAAEISSIGRVSPERARSECESCPARGACPFIQHSRSARRSPDTMGAREILIRTQHRQRDAGDGADYAWMVADEGLGVAAGSTVTRAHLQRAIGAGILSGEAVQALRDTEGPARRLGLLGDDVTFCEDRWEAEVERTPIDAFDSLPDAGALSGLAQAAQNGWHGVEIDRHGSVVLGGTYAAPMARPESCLVLDGTANRATCTAGWGELASFTAVRAERLGRVVAVVSEGSLTPDAVLPRDGRENAEGWARYCRFHTPRPGGRYLHVMRKGILAHPKGKQLRAQLEAAGDAVTYVGAPDARGSNAYQDCIGVICDPYLVPGHALRAEARALRLCGVSSAEAAAAARQSLQDAPIRQAAARVRAVRNVRHVVTWGRVDGLPYTDAVPLSGLGPVLDGAADPAQTVREAALAVVAERGFATAKAVIASVYAGVRGRNTNGQNANIDYGTLSNSVPRLRAERLADVAGLQIMHVTSSLPGGPRAVLYVGDPPALGVLAGAFADEGAAWIQDPDTGRCIALESCQWRAAILAHPDDAPVTPSSLAAQRGVSASLARRWVRRIGGADGLAQAVADARATRSAGAQIAGPVSGDGGGSYTVTSVSVSIDTPSTDSAGASGRGAVSFEHAHRGRAVLPMETGDDDSGDCVPARIDARTG